MSTRKPIWDILSEEKKKGALDAIMAFFQDEWGQSIGVIAAEQVLDLVMGGTFADIYNKGVVDAQKVLGERIADMNVDLDSLLRK